MEQKQCGENLGQQNWCNAEKKLDDWYSALIKRFTEDKFVNLYLTKSLTLET